MRNFVAPLFLALLTLSGVAYGSIYVRQHAADIQPGLKIEAQDLNDEFNAIAAAVNSIDGSNVTNGSLGVNAFAATSSAVSLNKKTGCDFSVTSDFTGVKSIDIKPPCEIFMDGTRGFITATTSISLLSNLDTGSVAAQTFYFVYATRDSSSLSFNFSTTPPSLATARKSTDSSARYVGTVRTCDASADLVRVRRIDSNKFIWTQDGCTTPSSQMAAPTAGLIATANSSSVTGTLTIPNTFDKILLKYSMYVSGFPAQCEIQYDQGTLLPYQAVVVATAGNTGIMPYWVTTTTLTSSARIGDISNCMVGGDLRVVGWAEPFSLHQ